MANNPSPGMISGMQPLNTITGEEFVEVIRREPDGSYKNFRLMISKIRNNEGLSAYEVAVKNGYQGTETEWLESLKGQGIYQLAVQQGFVGTEDEFLASLKGDDGAVGKSIYDVAVDTGFTGTEQEFLQTLVGKSAYQSALDTGFSGTEAEFIQSLKGADGDAGAKGDQGDVGPDGKSAYQVAVDNGFVGDEAEWLLSLNGIDGTKGDDGAAGADGRSAYQIAVDGGFVGTEQEWLASLNGTNGRSAYQIAVDGGFVGTEAQWLESLQGLNGKTAYESAIDGGFVGTEEEFNQSLASPKGVNGGVFITDVMPANGADNVGEKAYSTDGYSLVSCSSSTRNVIVEVSAVTGHTNFRPVVKVNGVTVTLTADGNAPMWSGSVAITLPAQTGADPVVIEAVHEDGAKTTANVLSDTAPVILTATFTGDYPVGQTELKAGDVMAINFTVDQPIVGYEISNEGAFVYTENDVVESAEQTIMGLVIADRGNVATDHGFKIRVKKASGVYSEWFNSADVDTVEKVNVVKLNNLKPTIVFGAVTYPVDQTAIKVGESATVANTINNADAVTYSSGNGQLTVTNPTQNEAAKSVAYLAGDYNDLTNNLTVVATRAANGTTATASTIVKIANVAPSLTVSTPAARLRSGGNQGTIIQRHTITITSSQSLAEAPSMNAPGGNWDAAAWTSNAAKKVWTRVLLVHDDDAKGDFTFDTVSAKGLAGVTTNTLAGGANYTIGGFVFRTLNVAAYPNREAAIGTMVAMTSKLRCSNLSKGASGSLNFTYQANDTDGANLYTVKNGNSWYNCDAANAVSNTSGLMSIELEEAV